MQALINRIEDADCSDEAIDAAIVAELHDAIVRPYPPTDDFGPKNRWQFWSRDGKHFLANEGKWKVPPYTNSIDAARTLMPDGWAWFVEDVQVPGLKAAARSWIPAQRTQGLSCESFHCEAVTPAIALCIAALKARAAVNIHNRHSGDEQ